MRYRPADPLAVDMDATAALVGRSQDQRRALADWARQQDGQRPTTETNSTEVPDAEVRP